MLRMVNLISGGGSTNLAILREERPGGRLHGLTETVAVVSSDSEAKGIEKAEEEGFPPKHIWVVDPRKGNLKESLLDLLNIYKPDYFHQLGWMPLTPSEVIERYRGLNQHLGPGGKGMYGIRRILAHQLFCQAIGKDRPIPVFCQWVVRNYDEGGVVYVRYCELSPKEIPEMAAERLLRDEHRVQIEGRYSLTTGQSKEQKVPQIAWSQKEKKILEWAKNEARNKYPSK